MPKYRVYCETEGTNVSVWAAEAPTECPNDAGHTIRAGSGSILEEQYLSLEKRVNKVEKVNRISQKLNALRVDSYMDDFVDDTGIDAAESSGYFVHPEDLVEVAEGEASATVVSMLVTTKATKQAVTVSAVLHSGAPTISVSGDDGATWSEVTSYDTEMSLSGKKWRLKAVLNPGDQLAAWAFELG